MDFCKLCMQSSDMAFQLDSAEGIMRNALKMLQKHFPFCFANEKSHQIDDSICWNCFRKVEDFHNFYSFVENVHQIGAIKPWCEFDIKLEMTGNDDDDNDPPKPNLLETIITTSEFSMATSSPMRNGNQSETSKRQTRAKSRPDETTQYPILETMKNQSKSSKNKSQSASKSKNQSKSKRNSKKMAQSSKQKANKQPHTPSKLRKPSKGKRNSSEIIQSAIYNLPAMLQPLVCLQTIHIDEIKKQEDNNYDSDFGEHDNDFLPERMSSEDDDDPVYDKNWFNEQINAKQPKPAKKPKSDQPKQYICEFCGKVCKTRNAYIYHKESTHMQLQFECDICGAQLKSKICITNHMRRVHVGVEPTDACKICGKIVKHKRTHEMRHEANYLTRFKCLICQRGFATKQKLREHSSTHSGLRTLKCPMCEDTFRFSSTLSNHKKKMHSH